MPYGASGRTREIDEEFIEDAIARYRRIDERLAEFANASARAELTVHSPDGLVAVVVAVDGTIRDIDIDERCSARTVSTSRGRSGRR